MRHEGIAFAINSEMNIQRVSEKQSLNYSPVIPKMEDFSITCCYAYEAIDHNDPIERVHSTETTFNRNNRRPVASDTFLETCMSECVITRKFAIDDAFLKLQGTNSKQLSGRNILTRTTASVIFTD